MLKNPRHRRYTFDPLIRKIPWRRSWQPTPVFLPGKSYKQKSRVGYRPWGREGSDTTEHARTWHCVFLTLSLVESRCLISITRTNRRKGRSNKILLRGRDIFIYLFLKYLAYLFVIFGCSGSSLLCACRLSLAAASAGYSSLVVEHRLLAHGSVVVLYGLSRC